MKWCCLNNNNKKKDWGPLGWTTEAGWRSRQTFLCEWNSTPLAFCNVQYCVLEQHCSPSWQTFKVSLKHFGDPATNKLKWNDVSLSAHPDLWRCVGEVQCGVLRDVWKQRARKCLSETLRVPARSVLLARLKGGCGLDLSGAGRIPGAACCEHGFPKMWVKFWLVGKYACCKKDRAHYNESWWDSARA